METTKKYKFIHFTLIGQGIKGKFQEWDCLQNKEHAVLGSVLWYSPWKKYVFVPATAVVFDEQCLADIRDFLIKISK